MKPWPRVSIWSHGDGYAILVDGYPLVSYLGPRWLVKAGLLALLAGMLLEIIL